MKEDTIAMIMGSGIFGVIMIIFIVCFYFVTGFNNASCLSDIAKPLCEELNMSFDSVYSSSLKMPIFYCKNNSEIYDRTTGSIDNNYVRYYFTPQEREKCKMGDKI